MGHKAEQSPSGPLGGRALTLQLLDPEKVRRKAWAKREAKERQESSWGLRVVAFSTLALLALFGPITLCCWGLSYAQ